MYLLVIIAVLSYSILELNEIISPSNTRRKPNAKCCCHVTRHRKPPLRSVKSSCYSLERDFYCSTENLERDFYWITFVFCSFFDFPLLAIAAIEIEWVKMWNLTGIFGLCNLTLQAWCVSRQDVFNFNRRFIKFIVANSAKSNHNQSKLKFFQLVNLLLCHPSQIKISIYSPESSGHVTSTDWVFSTNEEKAWVRGWSITRWKWRGIGSSISGLVWYQRVDIIKRVYSGQNRSHA